MTGQLRVVVVEDEAVIARRLARMTAAILGPETSVALAPDLESARRESARQAPDIVILDLNLRGAAGFDLLGDPVLRSCPTVVVSAHVDRAIEAFDFGVRDFVPKPFTRERLERALRRALDARTEGSPALAVRRGSSTVFVPAGDVAYVRASGARSRLVLADGKVVEHGSMLDRLERLLPRHFARIHRSTIVNTARVTALVTLAGSRYRVRLENGVTLRVGRKRVAGLRRLLAQQATGERGRSRSDRAP